LQASSPDLPDESGAPRNPKSLLLTLWNFSRAAM